MILIVLLRTGDAGEATVNASTCMFMSRGLEMGLGEERWA